MSKLRLSLFVLACSISGGAFAGTSVAAAQITDRISQTILDSGLEIVNGTSASAQVNDPQGAAQSFADYNTGVLRAAATSPAVAIPTDPASLTFVTAGTAQIGGNVTIGNAGAGFGSVSWTIDGTLKAFDGHNLSAALLIFGVTPAPGTIGVPFGTTEVDAFESGVDPSCTANRCFVVGTTFSQSGTFTFPIVSGEVLNLSMGLSAIAGGGGFTDTFHTAQMTLNMPAGVTYATDGLLAAAVPEPSSAALCLLGLAAVGGIARIRRPSV